MIRIELGELTPAPEVRITTEQGVRLARSGVVTAAPSPYVPGAWLISPAGKVGAARIGDIEVHIAPKLPVARLLFLAGYAGHGAAWRDEDVLLGDAPDIVPALAQALWRQIARAIHQGLLPGYVVVEESSPMLRGRLLETVQLHRHHGLPFPLEIQHDEFTTDIPENQILRTACERILAVPRVDLQSQRMLRKLLREFTDVTPLTRGEPVPRWKPTRQNLRYHSALRLAELVLRATSAEQGPGGVTFTGFLFDMPTLFEEFVTVALGEAIEREYDGRVVGQDRRYFLDEASRIRLRPDIVWYLRGKPVAVADAKYKAEQPAGYPNADLYQLLAYCTALGLTRGHLIYAKGAGDAASHTIREAGIEIICHALELDAGPASLLGQIRDLARLFASQALAMPVADIPAD
jgi:5-methylcytosine-specific restriction enzyme subunit McrC